MSTNYRVTVAFLLAPLAASIAVTCALLPFDRIALPGFAVAATFVSYLCALVMGVPAFLLTRSRKLTYPAQYAIVGFVIGTVPALLFGSLLSDAFLGTAILGGAVVEALVFGAIAT